MREDKERAEGRLQDMIETYQVIGQRRREAAGRRVVQRVRFLQMGRAFERWFEAAEGGCSGCEGLQADVKSEREGREAAEKAVEGEKVARRAAVRELEGVRAECMANTIAAVSARDAFFEGTARRGIMGSFFSAWAAGGSGGGGEEQRLRSERDALSFALSAAHCERDALSNQLTSMAGERDALSTQLASAVSERDALSASLQEATSERDALSADRLDLISDRDALYADKDIIATGQTLNPPP